MTRFRTLCVGAACVLAASAAGCVDYTIETTIRPDGSGERLQRFEVTRNTDFDLSPQAFEALTGAGAGPGWATTTRLDSDGDTVRVVERRETVATLDGWNRFSDAVLLHGTTPDRADERLGIVRLGDVEYRTTLEVRRSHRSDGSEVVAYHESFAWQDAAAVIVEALVASADAELRRGFPDLQDEGRGEVLGYFRARLWAAGEAGAFSEPDADALMDEAAARTVAHAVRIVGDPAAEPALRGVFTRAVDVESADTEATFEDRLPGLTLGFNMSMIVRVTMPGTVVDTNADDRDGNTLEWRFSPFDDLSRAVELRAEAVVGG